VLLGSDILEVVVGVVFLFTILAVVASAVTEAVSQAFAMRSRTLSKAVVELLGSEEARNKFYEHPLIHSLSRQGYVDKAFRRMPRPSYVPSSVFAATLTNLIPAAATPAGITFTLPPWAVGTPVGTRLQTVLETITNQIPEAERSAERVRDEIATWFDQSMDRVQGWYKRMTQVVIFIVAAVVVIFMNADALRFADSLAVNPQVRAAVVAAADRLLPSDTGGALPDVAAVKAELAKLDSSLGWADGDKTNPRTPPSLSWSIDDWVVFFKSHLAGWLITIFAISLGAPFWFDVLGRVAQLRGAGQKPNESPPGTT
jgi:hypothetical protein